MGTNILFWNGQGTRSKRKELELYLKENVIDIIALNERFLSKKHNFKIPGYDIFLLTGLRIYTGEYKAQGPTLCPTEGRALRGPRALYSPV